MTKQSSNTMTDATPAERKEQGTTAKGAEDDSGAGSGAKAGGGDGNEAANTGEVKLVNRAAESKSPYVSKSFLLRPRFLSCFLKVIVVFKEKRKKKDPGLVYAILCAGIHLSGKGGLSVAYQLLNVSRLQSLPFVWADYHYFSF